ncbi:unnamed protein product [Peronospora belbahrii]|uniref:Uncharacterized protein n=1 Tax=Peronospora belbahrii TaxID=622444 RepID=A0AAU9L6P8_9STRA|nr:unnamed protein product [Peronospora belbahrii]CAH0522691.1 unnamed protein product [Peronospora belbahrii]
MDLSMILSPAVEEETTNPRAPASCEHGRNWSSDELQCAVAILQDFQQPTIASLPTVQDPTRDDSGPKQTRFYPGHEQECKQEKNDNNITSQRHRPNDEVFAVSGREVQKNKSEGDVQQQNSASGVWGDDSMSKLDLLVQADEIIKQRRPNSSMTHPGDKTQYLRSGVWSRSEEEYAAALVSYFLQGLLDLAEGTTLRRFLADELCCSRRRVSMKLATESLAGQKIPRKLGASAFIAAQRPPSEDSRLKVKRVLEKLREANFSSSPEGGRYHSLDTDKSHSFRRLFDPDEADGEDRAFNLHHGQMRRSVRTGRTTKRSKPTIIRTGFESPEEEEYVTTMVEFFMAGLLDLPEGTRLVRYLCQQLACTPKELSMKMAPQYMGEHKFPANVGSITYMRKESDISSSSNLEKDAFSEELFEVESRLTELRLAYEETHKDTLRSTVTITKRERNSSTASVSSTGTASVASTPDASPVRSFQRSGPWSHDEEVYAAALIDCFFKGVLDIAEGTTLRAFLSSRLCCNPMRISKKLSSESIAKIRIPKKLGSSTYALRAEVTPEEQAKTEETLRNLQHTYLHSSSKKRGSLLGSKRPRSSMKRNTSCSHAAARGGTDSDATESDSNTRSAGGSIRSETKLQKTEEAHSQQFQGLNAVQKQ